MYMYLCIYEIKEYVEYVFKEANLTRISDAFLDEDAFPNILGITFILNLKVSL